MTDRGEWEGRTGTDWAAEWRRTDRSFARLTEHLVARIERDDWSAALDIGCGAGELSLLLAQANRSRRIVGVDVSAALLEAARRRAAQSGLGNASFELADAAVWQPGSSFHPDLVVSRHGVMFFDDPVAAFANVARAVAPDAALVFSCFRAFAENPFFAEVARLLPAPPSPPDPDAPGPMAFADREKVASILTKGRWGEVAFEAFDFPLIAGDGPEPVEEAFTYFTRIGPAARAARDLDLQQREEFDKALRTLLEDNCRDGIVSLGAAAWIVSARRA